MDPYDYPLSSSTLHLLVCSLAKPVYHTLGTGWAWQVQHRAPYSFSLGAEVPRQTHIYLCMLHHCSTDITIDSTVTQSCSIFSCFDPSDFTHSPLNPFFSRNDFVYTFGSVLGDVFIAKCTRLFINVWCCTSAFAHTRERASFVNNDKCFLQLLSLCGMAWY